jgi:hypothetical protein
MFFPCVCTAFNLLSEFHRASLKEEQFKKLEMLLLDFDPHTLHLIEESALVDAFLEHSTLIPLIDNLSFFDNLYSNIFFVVDFFLLLIT